MMRQVVTQGDARTRGMQQGRATADLALPWIERTMADLCRQLDVSPQALAAKVDVDVRRWVNQWEAASPCIVQECHGLAEGLDLPLEKYLIHCCYHRLTGALPQCTIMGARDPHVVIGKTDDIEAQDLGLNIMEITRPDNGLAHVHFHFAGTVWTTAGMNEQGLAMGMTGIPGVMLEQDGLFSLLALHTILPACANVEAAVAHIQALPVNAYGFSLMLADRDGRLALVEKTGAGFHVVWHERGDRPLAHTNHILQPALAARNPQQATTLQHNSDERLACATRLLDQGVRVDRALAHRSEQGNICQQGEADLHTDYAVIMHPEAMTLGVWAGYPAERMMERIELRELFD